MISVIATRFAWRKTEMNERIVFVKGVRQVLNAFPLDTIHVKVQVNYVACALQDCRYLDQSLVSQLIEA